MQDTTKLAIPAGTFEGDLATSSGLVGSHAPIVDRVSSKRAFDITVALIAVFALSLVFVLVAIAIKLSSRGPVLFKHGRIGRNGERFDCLKFRTMHAAGDAILRDHLDAHPAARAEWQATQKLHHDPRITALGRVLRKSSVDELPQLINILRGDMSLVGPRPIVQSEVPRYGAHIRAYCSVRPGLTGLWQVSGRSDTSYDQRVAFDCEYVARRTFLYDLGIILRTLPAVFAARGAC
ncbi:sugar transferase [Methylobacterium planeticum]|uniref:Sugar transferase n=1 Tax=Methylobacterium planeticum TaxID=2615211 RepID=A0A6N6MI02_9HYPH|nr:sugar transferase [Methylobacterium planeticum]KAB1069576.1 sugar transferase [Methylobacterium planeticum]